MSVEEIIRALNEFAPFSYDDPTNDNETYLFNLMNAWKMAEDREKAIPSFFTLIERYPHADFGSPGPLVSALETNGVKGYEGELHRSLLRKPTPLTLWMYNRLINDENDLRIIKGHLERLRLFGQHPLADAETRSQADLFIKYQEQRLKSDIS